ncbi:MAG: hypothetical protein ACP5E3_12450 [Bacteroidales bacterium]
MKRISVYSILIVVIIIFAGCEKEEDSPFISQTDKLYIGYWKDKTTTDSTFIFERKSQLADDAYAFGILSDGTFLENKNAGWCGTPPITYAEFEGSWLELKGDTLLIETEYWGGGMSFYMIIKSVTENKLEAKIEYIRLDIPE